MKTSLLILSEILGLFGNTLTPDHLYPRQGWDKFLTQVQMLLSQKRKPFSQNFIVFLECGQNFRPFEKKKKKKNQLHSINISEFIDPEKYSYFNARKLLF